MHTFPRKTRSCTIWKSGLWNVLVQCHIIDVICHFLPLTAIGGIVGQICSASIIFACRKYTEADGVERRLLYAVYTSGRILGVRGVCLVVRGCVTLATMAAEKATIAALTVCTDYGTKCYPHLRFVE